MIPAPDRRQCPHAGQCFAARPSGRVENGPMTGHAGPTPPDGAPEARPSTSTSSSRRLSRAPTPRRRAEPPGSSRRREPGHAGRRPGSGGRPSASCADPSGAGQSSTTQTPRRRATSRERGSPRAPCSQVVDGDVGAETANQFRCARGTGWRPWHAVRLCCKPDVGVGQIRTTTVLVSCFCAGQTVL